jgi:hypothetical protein
LQVGVPIRSIAWFILADTVEILVAAWGVSYALNGVPRLNGVSAFARYSIFKCPACFKANMEIAKVRLDEVVIS